MTLLLSAAFCDGTIQVDQLPAADLILAHRQQHPPNPSESFEGTDYKTRKRFYVASENYF